MISSHFLFLFLISGILFQLMNGKERNLYTNTTVIEVTTKSYSSLSEKCPDNKKCVKCRVRTAPNPTDPLCTCCGNPKQCVHQHLCVPMQLFCSKGQYLKYSKTENAHICLPCPKGHYCNHRYCRDKCMSCNLGFEAAVSGATQCTPCRKGFYRSDIIHVECQECPYGYSTKTTGAVDCKPDDGIGNEPPLTCIESLCIHCENLPENASLTHPLCACCPSGMCSYRNSCNEFTIPCQGGVLKQSNSSCQFCPRGTYCNIDACSSCTPCPPGSEKHHNSYGECTLCKPGYFKENIGTDLCSQCSKGFYTVSTGSVSCKQCPTGYFCPSTVQPPFACSDEYSCPAGTWTPSKQKVPVIQKLKKPITMYELPANAILSNVSRFLIIVNFYLTLIL